MSRRLRIGGSLALAATFAMGASGQWRFVQRMFTYPDHPITDEGWYEPYELVPGGLQLPLPVGTTTITALADALREAGAYAMKKRSSALIVVHRDRIVYEQYAPDHAPSRRTNSMSMAKTIIGLLVGVAIADGDIASIDEPAATYLTEWGSDPRREISLRHLLEMRSGLENDRDVSSPFSVLTRMHLGPDVAPLILDIPLTRTPGETYEYNNMGSQLLTLIVERATGKRIATYAAEKLWKPLGAGDARMFLDDDGGLARGYCCFFATARDFARLGMMMRDRGRFAGAQVVPAAWIDAMTTPSPTNPEYGLQIWLAAEAGETRAADRSEPFADLEMFYLDGKHKQRVYVLASQSLVIVRVGEAPRGWDDSKLPNLLVRALTAQ